LFFFFVDASFEDSSTPVSGFVSVELTFESVVAVLTTEDNEDVVVVVVVAVVVDVGVEMLVDILESESDGGE
jgi:hypothetical protein